MGGILSENAAINLILDDQPHGTYVENVEGFEHHVDRKLLLLHGIGSLERIDH